MRYVFGVLILLGLGFVSSCSKSPTSPSGSLVHSCAGGTLTGSMSATVGSTSFVATCLTQLTNNLGLISFGATNVKQGNTSDFIDLAMGVQATAPGTYQFGKLSVNNASVSIGGSQLWQAGGTSNGTGSVTLTTVTATEIGGTFTFSMAAGPNATGTKNVTNGKFDIKQE